MRQILIRLSNVVAWLNLLIGLCVGLAFSYFSPTFLLNGNNDPLIHDSKSQTILNELNVDGIYSRSNMSLKSPDDMAAMMALRLRLDGEESSAERRPLTFDFTPEQASEAWNNIARHKLAQEERNKKRTLQKQAANGLVVSALAGIPYVLLALLNYVFTGSFRFIPWVPVHKSS
jgi:hypothetical protein